MNGEDLGKLGASVLSNDLKFSTLFDVMEGAILPFDPAAIQPDQERVALPGPGRAEGAASGGRVPVQPGSRGRAGGAPVRRLVREHGVREAVYRGREVLPPDRAPVRRRYHVQSHRRKGGGADPHRLRLGDRPDRQGAVRHGLRRGEPVADHREPVHQPVAALVSGRAAHRVHVVPERQSRPVPAQLRQRTARRPLRSSGA